MAVYLIQAGGVDGPVKIGWARNVGSRLRQLQTGNPVPLKLIREIDHGSPRAEMWLHGRFAPHRLRGEWYRFDAEMLAIELPVLITHERKKPPRLNRAPLPVDPAHDLRSNLLNEIAAFLRDSPRPIAETTFGRFSVNDGKFVARLRERKNITLDRMARCRQFMAEQRARWAGGDDRGRRAA